MSRLLIHRWQKYAWWLRSLQVKGHASTMLIHGRDQQWEPSFIHYSACIKQALVYKQPQETNTCAFSDDLPWIYSTELWIYSGIYLSLILCLTPEWVHVLVSALNPGFLFWILSRSFGEKLIFLQSCKTKSGTKSLGSRLLVSCPGHVHLSVQCTKLTFLVLSPECWSEIWQHTQLRMWPQSWMETKYYSVV